MNADYVIVVRGRCKGESGRVVGRSDTHVKIDTGDRTRWVAVDRVADYLEWSQEDWR